MVEWGWTDGSLTAMGLTGEATVEMVDWTPTPPVCDLPYPVEAALSGRVESLSIPEGRVSLDDCSEPWPESGRLPQGEHLLSVDGPLETLVRFRGPATVETAEGVTLNFDGDAPVSLGFRKGAPTPRTRTVPPTPAGVAAAVTEAAGTLHPLGPERSRPSNRPHPPLVAFDEDATLEDSDRPITFRVPADLEHVLVAAPFAYYLGAKLVAEDRPTPMLEAPAVGFERPYGSLPAFAPEVATDCRRAFYLDCLARAEPGEETLDREPLTALGLDPAVVRDVSPAIRYATYLDAPPDVVDLPSWHLSTYVDANYEHARSLPYLLDRLSLVYPAEASELEPQDLLERSLDDFFRGDVVSVSPVDPDLGVGATHAWLAAGEPVEAFKTTTRAHENRLAAEPDGETLSVEVIVNDPEMADELTVADRYRDAALPLSVTVRESLSVEALARAFERDTDFVHYVGHCEVDGLQCPDGHLSTSSLHRSGATTFFLNACGSYHEGQTLVEKGSVVGGVTLDKVLNEQATRVGTAFGRLLVHGFGIDRALSLARRRIMMGQDYAVVGDGTFALAPTCDHPAVLHVDPLDDGYEVEYAVASTRAAGACYDDPVTDTRQLYWTETRRSVDEATLGSLLEQALVPVVFDGELHWSDSLVADRRSGRLTE